MAKSPASKPTNSRSTILEVSIRLFADHGFEGVAMRQIAKEANITLPAIYHHFGNKEELYKAVEAEMYGSHAQSLLNDIRADNTPEERIRNFIGTLLDRLEENPSYLKLLQRNLIEGWEQNQKYLVDISLQNVFNDLKELLNEYSENCGNGIVPVAIFSMLLGFLTMQPVTRQLSGYKYAKSRKKEKYEILTNAVMNFIKANKEL